MAKSTKFSTQELEKMGMYESSPGVYERKKKLTPEQKLISNRKKEEYEALFEPFPKESVRIDSEIVVDATDENWGYITFGPYLGDSKNARQPELLISFPVDPIGKPRMTQSDKWKKRPATDRYWELKAQMKQIAEGTKFTIPESGIHIISYIPMPDSWPKKKKEEMRGKPHKQKPDVDNICKGIFDALCKDDSYVWDCRISKRWDYKGRIDIYKID